MRTWLCIAGALAACGPTVGPDNGENDGEEDTGSSTTDEPPTVPPDPTTTGIPPVTVSSSADSSTGGPIPGSSSSTGGPPADCSLSHAVDIQPIFDANCTPGCHSPGGAWSPMPLVDSYDVIVGQDSIQTSGNPDLRIIAPGDVENSYMLHKLRGTNAEAVGDKLLAGLRMPALLNPDYDPQDPGNTEPQFISNDPLPPEMIQLIEDWVVCGAPL